MPRHRDPFDERHRHANGWRFTGAPKQPRNPYAEPTRTDRLLAAAKTAIRRWRHRNRWQLRSVYVALAAWPTAVLGKVAVLADCTAYVWLAAIIMTAAAATLAVKLKGRALLKSKKARTAAPLGLLAATAWCTAAAFWLEQFPGQLAFAWLIAALVGCGVWITDHRTREKVHLIKKADEVPDTVGFAGYPDLKLIEVTAILGDDGTKTGISYYFECPRGMVRSTIDKAKLESAFPSLRPGALTLVNDPHHGRRFWAKVVEVNPWTERDKDIIVPHPAVENLALLQQLQARIDAGEDGVPIPAELSAWMPGSSVRQPRPLGNRDDGHPVTIVMWDSTHGAHRVLMGGFTGSGKTCTTNDLIAALAPCTDTVLWGIDVAKGGKAFRHWGDVFDKIATTPREATRMLQAGQEVITGRQMDAADELRQLDKIHPTVDEQQLIIIVEEGSALFGKRNGFSEDATTAAEGIAEGGREPAVSLVIITQRGDMPSVGNSGRLKTQLDIQICLRMKSAAEGRFILPSYSSVDVAALAEAGTFYMQSSTEIDPRKCRSYALATDENEGYKDVEALAAFYGPYRKPLNPQSARHITNGFYGGPVKNPEGLTVMRNDPIAGLFERPTASTAQPDPAPAPAQRTGNAPTRAEVHEFARGVAGEIRASGASVEAALRAPEVPRDLAQEDLRPSGEAREVADLNDPVTRAILGVLYQRGDRGASNSQIITALGDVLPTAPSSPTVLRRCNALARAVLAESEGTGRATLWKITERGVQAAENLAAKV